MPSRWINHMTIPDSTCYRLQWIVDAEGKAWCWTEAMSNLKKSERRRVAERHQAVMQRRRRILACFLPSLEAERRRPTANRWERRYHLGPYHPIHLTTSSNLTSTTTGRASRSSKNVRYTGWRTSNLQTPGVPYIHRSCSAISCTRI